MSSMPLMAATLVISSLLCFVMNSWVSIWVVLELNTLSFCSVMKDLSKEKKLTTDMAMKYFIVQSIASVVLIFSSIFGKISSELLLTLMFLSALSLLVKMGASPFHQWFVGMVKNTKWKLSTILMTWQKLAPVFLVVYQVKSTMTPFLLISSWVGSISQINKKGVMEIMAFSSVFNLSWMLLAVSVSTKLLLAFSIIYWISVTLMMNLIYLAKMKTLGAENHKSIKSWLAFTVIVNLAGLPPMAGFLAKWSVAVGSLGAHLAVVTTLLLVTSAINLYIYMRVLNAEMVSITQIRQKGNAQSSKKAGTVAISANFLPLGVVTM